MHKLQWFESCCQSLHPSSTLIQRASTHCVAVFTSKTAFCRSVSFNFSRQLGGYSIDSVLLIKNTLTLHSGSFPVDRRMEVAGQGSASNDFRIYSTVARLHVKYCSSKLLPDTRGKLWTLMWTCTGYYRHWASPQSSLSKSSHRIWMNKNQLDNEHVWFPFTAHPERLFEPQEVFKTWQRPHRALGWSIGVFSLCTGWYLMWACRFSDLDAHLFFTYFMLLRGGAFVHSHVLLPLKRFTANVKSDDAWSWKPVHE